MLEARGQGVIGERGLGGYRPARFQIPDFGGLKFPIPGISEANFPITDFFKIFQVPDFLNNFQMQGRFGFKIQLVLKK